MTISKFEYELLEEICVNAGFTQMRDIIQKIGCDQLDMTELTSAYTNETGKLMNKLSLKSQHGYTTTFIFASRGNSVSISQRKEERYKISDLSINHNGWYHEPFRDEPENREFTDFMKRQIGQFKYDELDVDELATLIVKPDIEDDTPSLSVLLKESFDYYNQNVMNFEHCIMFKDIKPID